MVNYMRINYFEKLHPSINFIYFAAVIFCSMFFMHPVFLAISLSCGFAYSVMLNRRKALRFSLCFIFPMMAVTMVLNPLINHAGATILLYINDNPITLEACLYGIAASAMFASVILWFSCSNRVMTADKFTYLFGRVLPALSLMFSMVMRFVPHYKTKIREIASAQEGIGRGIRSGSVLARAKNGMRILSILVTWALENGVTTSDSMRARGHGLPGHTNFSIFRFDSRDKAFLLTLLFLIALVLSGFFLGENTVRYFPSVHVPPVTPVSILVYGAYFLLCFFPIGVNFILEVKYHGSF